MSLIKSSISWQFQIFCCKSFCIIRTSVGCSSRDHDFKWALLNSKTWLVRAGGKVTDYSQPHLAVEKRPPVFSGDSLLQFFLTEPTVCLSDATICHTWSRCMTNITVCARAPRVSVFLLISHIWTITYLLTDPCNEPTAAEERLSCLQILVISNISVLHVSPLKLYDCRCTGMTSLSLHSLNSWNIVTESSLSHLPLLSHSLLQTLNNTGSVCLMNQFTLLDYCY